MNDIVKRDTTAVANWEDKLAAYAKEAAQQERPTSSYISLRSGMLSYQGQPVPNNKLQVIILDVAVERDYYEGRFDPLNVRSPVCFALTKMGEDEVPHELSVKKQHDNCAECEWNKWGTAIRDGVKTRGKACQERRRMIIIPAHDMSKMNPDEILAAEVATLKTPVTSVRLWGQYVSTVAGLFQRPPFGVITEIGVVPNQKNQFNLTFKVIDKVDIDLLQAILQKQEMAQNILYKPYDPNDLNQEDEEEAPAKKKGKFDK